MSFSKKLPLFAWAMLLFAAINLLMSIKWNHWAFSLGCPDDKSMVAQACNSAINDFKNQIEPPKIILAGSSLMMSPIWSLDAQAFPNITDIYHHHQALIFTKTLLAQGIETSTFAFALPGVMASDIYLIGDKLLQGKKAPALLIYGIAPRDFMDDLLTGETKTAVFQLLSDLSDLFCKGDIYLSNWDEKADYACSHAVLLYGKRYRYQDKMANFYRQIMARLFGQAADVSPSTSPEQGFQFTIAGASHNQVWAKSIEEYKARYKHFNCRQFDKQMTFLQAMLKTAKRNQTHVLLVNMPLTQDNMQLMPAGFYKQYKDNLIKLATQEKVSLLDLNGNADFRDDCFYDTVHLNAKGGKKLVSRLASWVQSQTARRPPVLASLNSDSLF